MEEGHGVQGLGLDIPRESDKIPFLYHHPA